MNMNHLFGRKAGRTEAKTALGLLRDVREIIRTTPEVYNQRGTLDIGRNSCGTEGCVGGWCAVRLFGRRQAFAAHWNADVLHRVARRMGLTSDQEYELFQADAAGARYDIGGMPDAAGHAARGVAHIDRFIKRHYTQLRYTRLSRA